MWTFRNFLIFISLRFPRAAVIRVTDWYSMGAARAPRGPLRPLLWLALLCSCPAPGARGQQVEVPQVEVLQPGGPVVVSAGDSATLRCTVKISGGPVIGSLRWYKGTGAGRELIYNDTGSFPRVSSVSPGSDTDRSVTIGSVRPADAGVYYCVQFRRKDGAEAELASGPGTRLSVRARPSPPKISAPPGRVEIGEIMNFSCTSEGFSPKDITVTWVKGDQVIPSQMTTESIQEHITFNVTSKATVTLGREDIKSQLTCQITHSTLTSALSVSTDLSDIIRVSPQVKVEAHPSFTVQLNTSVQITITCTVKGFYPQGANISWLVNNTPLKASTIPERTPEDLREEDGTYSLRSSLELHATQQWNQSVFTCRAVHLGREMDPKQVKMIITQEPTETVDPSGGQSSGLVTYYVLAACAVLALLLITAIIIFIRVKKNRDKGSGNDRSTHAGSSTLSVAQEPAAKDITYAELDLRGRPKGRPKSRYTNGLENEHCEYACVQTGATPQNDNLTYADLDAVQLNGGLRNARPSPAEASSEYAEVHIRKH